MRPARRLAANRLPSIHAVVLRIAMTSVYFYLCAGLSLLLSLWYSTSLTTTATRLGYQALWPTPASGYLGLLCALQIGVAGVCMLLAANPATHRRGLRAAAGFWTASIGYRLFSGTLHWPVSRMTMIATGAELLLLGLAIVLMLRQGVVTPAGH